MPLNQRDFIDLMDFTATDLEQLLNLATQMKAGLNTARYLTDRSIGLLFNVPSTRTRISFAVAARQLGGHAEYLNAKDLQLANNESLEDTAAVISRYLDAIVVRMYDMSRYGWGRNALNTIAQQANVPVINALDDKDHPCQVMADILTLRESFGLDYKRKILVMTWGYASRQKSPGVLHSMLTAGSLLGMHVRIAHPKGFKLDDEYLAFAERAASCSGATIEFSNDLMEASEGADVIYVKSWKSLTMSSEQDLKVRSEIKDLWCVGKEHFFRANPGAYYMDCLPLIRGEQVTAEVADGPNSIIYDQAENRLHIQKAILAYIVKDSGLDMNKDGRK